MVTESIPNLKVFIAGSGPQEKELKNQVKKLNLENHVKLLGYISNEEKYQYYKDCKVVVVPSRWDCQPITLFEAAASGKPVIASNVGGISEMIENNKDGILIEAGNSKQLAENILNLLSDSQLKRKISINARKKVEDKFDSKIMANRTKEFYENIIERS